MPTFGSWEATVLAETYDVVDYVSLHAYYQQHGDDRDSFLACATDMDQFIEAVVATADHVARGRAGTASASTSRSTSGTSGTRAGSPASGTWRSSETPRLIEDVYSVTDAVVVGNLLISLLRHADRVKIGCLAQLVNVIAPIMTEPGGPAWRQASFHPFALTSRYGRGTVLRVEPDAPRHETAEHGEVPLLDAVAVRPDEGGVVLFAVNRSQTEPMTLDVDLRALHRPVRRPSTPAWPTTTRTRSTAWSSRTGCVPRRLDDPKLDGGRLQAVLPALSWNMIQADS